MEQENTPQDTQPDVTTEPPEKPVLPSDEVSSKTIRWMLVLRVAVLLILIGLVIVSGMLAYEYY